MNERIYPGLKYESRRRIVLGYSDCNPDDFVPMILDVICKAYKLDIKRLLGPDRNYAYVKARHIAMFEIRIKTGMALAKIGRVFNRNHSSVCYGIETYRDLLKFDKGFQEMVKRVEW